MDFHPAVDALQNHGFYSFHQRRKFLCNDTKALPNGGIQRGHVGDLCCRIEVGPALFQLLDYVTFDLLILFFRYLVPFIANEKGTLCRQLPLPFKKGVPNIFQYLFKL